MRPLDRLRRWIARSDVQTAWITGAALLFAVLLPGLVLYAYAASESLEEIDRWFEFVLQVVVREVEERGAGEIALDDVRGRLPNLDAAVRVHAANGELLVRARGLARAQSTRFRRCCRAASGASSAIAPSARCRLLAALELDRRRADHGLGRARASSRCRCATSLPRSAEIRRRVLVGTAVAASAVLLIGLATTMRAFSPLRRATAQLRDVDTGSLGVRLPSRGTGDPIDLHAETLNRVLARIDAGFARLRAFSSDVAHELRTPLNRISNVSEVALLEGRRARAARGARGSPRHHRGARADGAGAAPARGDRRAALRAAARADRARAAGSSSTSRRTRRRSRRPGVKLAAESEAVADRGRSRAARPDRREPARQRAQPRAGRQQRRDPRRAARRRRRDHRRRRGPGHRGGRPRARVRPLRAPRRRESGRATGSGSRWRARSRSCTAARCACRGRRSAARASSCGCQHDRTRAG